MTIPTVGMISITCTSHLKTLDHGRKNFTHECKRDFLLLATSQPVDYHGNFILERLLPSCVYHLALKRGDHIGRTHFPTFNPSSERVIDLAA